MTTLKIRVLALAALWCMSTVRLGAQIVIGHHGDSDPVTEGFGGGPLFGALVGPVVGDQGMNAWSINLDSSSQFAFYDYSLSAAEKANAMTRGWIMSAVLRMVSVPDEGKAMSISFRTGSKYFIMKFGTQPDGDPFVDVSYPTTVPEQVVALEGVGGGYHHYSLVYDPVTTTADLWIDGQERLSDLTGVGSSSSSRLSWGAGQAVTHANWSEASLSLSSPELSMRDLPSRQVELSWRTNFSGFDLEASTSITGTLWEPVTNAVATSNEVFTVIVGATNTSQFFRLREP